MPIPAKSNWLKSPPKRPHRPCGPPSAYPGSTEKLFLPAVKRRKRESDHWPPPSAQIHKPWSCASTILYASTAYQRTTFHSHRWWKWPFHSEGTSKLPSKQAQCKTTATTQQAQHVELCPLACTQHRDVRACSSRREWHMAIAIVSCQVAGPTCSTFMEKRTLQLLLWRSSSCVTDEYDIWLRMCIK